MDVQLLAGLLLVEAKKITALALAKPASGALARQVLSVALDLERQLAALAEQNQRAL